MPGSLRWLQACAGRSLRYSLQQRFDPTRLGVLAVAVAMGSTEDGHEGTWAADLEERRGGASDGEGGEWIGMEGRPREGHYPLGGAVATRGG